MTRPEVIRAMAARIAALRAPHPVRVAIDGIDAAGKTSLADELAVEVARLGRPALRASVDDFQRPRAERHARGPLSPEGYFHDAFDYATLTERLLAPLGPGGDRLYRRASFDLRADRPVEAPAERAPEDAVLLLDGVFLLRRGLRASFEHSIFVRVDFEIGLTRAASRDRPLFASDEALRERYDRRYYPAQRHYLATEAPEAAAAEVLDNNDPAHPILLRPR